MRQFQWKRIKQVYDPFAQDLVGDKVCHIMADGIHYGLQSQIVIPDIEQDYEKFEQVDHFLERMAEEIGDWAGRPNFVSEVGWLVTWLRWLVDWMFVCLPGRLIESLSERLAHCLSTLKTTRRL